MLLLFRHFLSRQSASTYTITGAGVDVGVRRMLRDEMQSSCARARGHGFLDGQDAWGKHTGPDANHSTQNTCSVAFLLPGATTVARFLHVPSCRAEFRIRAAELSI